MTFPTVVVEFAFSAGASTSIYLHLDDPARGKLDTGTLAPDVVWSDVSAYVRHASWSRGASRVDGPLLRYGPGTATIELDDSDRRFDPTNTSGPYTSAGVTQVTPMRAVRIRATHNGITYDLWRGYVDSWKTQYMPGNNLTVCTVQATDGTKVLRQHSRSAVSAVGAGEDSGARISRILDSVSWSATDRIIGTGDSTLQSTTLEGEAWAEMQLTQDSEFGELYFDGAGRVAFRGRYGVLEDTRSTTSQATFGDGGGSELPYRDVNLAYDDEQLINLARITRVGGAEQTAQDTTSQSDYLTRTFERSDLIVESDTVAEGYAEQVIYTCKDPELRFDALTLGRDSTSATEDLLFAQILGREIGDRITIKRRPPGGGSTITRDVFIRGMQHEVTRDLTWSCTWPLQAATKASFLVLDHATLGQLDANALAY